ncbi:MAG TPA: class I SAM-dependent methyltransferase [Bacteroidales bacterium]|nr:class I SAM-dependent methyltransferase [Bacteroidales bacterium]
MNNYVEKYCELPKSVRKPLWRVWHNMIISYDKNKETTFLNYGFESENGEFKTLNLLPEDEINRYSIQLYHHVARNHNFPDTDILEVGSGRGGGASFLTRYLKPRSYTAVDIAKKTIEFCNKHHSVEGLKFVRAEAEKLPFEASSFDAVLNVESARCYPNIGKFFSEVYRVLKPDGKFLYADMIKKEDIDIINDKLQKAGFKILECENIRQNVVNALIKDSASRKSAIDKGVPRIFRKSFYEFAGVEGSERFNSFDNSSMGYWCYTLVKNSE